MTLEIPRMGFEIVFIIREFLTSSLMRHLLFYCKIPKLLVVIYYLYHFGDLYYIRYLFAFKLYWLWIVFNFNEYRMPKLNYFTFVESKQTTKILDFGHQYCLGKFVE